MNIGKDNVKHLLGEINTDLIAIGLCLNMKSNVLFQIKHYSLKSIVHRKILTETIQS